MITISILVAVLAALFLVVLSGSVVYLIVSGRRIKRSLYEETQLQLNTTQGALENEKQRTEVLSLDLQKLSDRLEKEREQHLVKHEEVTSLKAQYQAIQDNYQIEKATNERQQEEIRSHHDSIQSLQQRLSGLKAVNDSLVEKLDTQKTEIENIRKTSLLEFKDVANKLLEEKSERFAKMNEERIDQILKPLGENIESFKKKVEETYDKESKARFSLEEKIKDLVRLNEQISTDATNLTRALKGDSKTQGDWGEVILERILEMSGLVKNREYFVQETFRDETGKLKKPDVRVIYPDDRYVIIDSKVSLTAYERYASADDPEAQKLNLAQHIKSIRNHIDGLAQREYEDMKKSLDFVMLFMPIEPAYMVAMREDPSLWNYAYQKRILLISPTNLIAALKLIADIWKRDYQNRNAREIAKRGERLYDKFVGFVKELEAVGKNIDRARNSYEGAMNKLQTGRGNLIGQASKLKKLGLKPKKSIPDSMMPVGDEEE